MDRDTKDTFFFILSFFGNALVDRASILMYHSVAENDAFFTVHPDDFRRQLRYLQDQHFDVLSLSNLIARLNAGSDISRTVCLTFDDGYRDNYEHVLPLLIEYQLPATIFLVTGLIGKSTRTSEGIQLPMLRLNEIMEMQQSGLVEFMPHTESHVPLPELSMEDASKQVENSRTRIEELTGTTANILSYPKGRYTGYIANYLKSHNWLGAATVEEGLVTPESDPFTLPRNSIDSSTTFTQFKGKISPAIDRYVALKSWFT